MNQLKLFLFFHFYKHVSELCRPSGLLQLVSFSDFYQTAIFFFFSNSERLPIFISESIIWLIRRSVCLQLTSQGFKTGITSLLYWVEQSPDVLYSSAAKESTKLDGTAGDQNKRVFVLQDKLPYILFHSYLTPSSVSEPGKNK